MAKKKRSSRSRGGFGSQNGSSNGSSSGGNGGSKPRTRRRRRGGGGGGGGKQNGGSNGEPADFVSDAPLEEWAGILEMHPNGYGFLRSASNNYTRERTDPFVPGTMVEKFGLRQGVMLHTMVQQAKRQQGPRVREILDVDGQPPEKYPDMPLFDDLTAINPEEFLKLEKGKQPLTNRVIDLLAPLGRGQRALIVAPPRSGKTIMLQHIAEGMSENHPDVKLMVLLIDERPEEVTDMRRSITNGEVIASSLDMDIESHVRLSQLAIDRAKRLAESGQDVFLMLDSITRLARAFNKWVGKSGRGGATGTGGLDIRAMDVPKKLFATARAFQEGGSLTIVGTCLVDTNSRMDEAIFQEFKGTGNMEVVLDRRLADRRVYPAIDISQSGTRREELLLDEETYETVSMLRRTLSEMHPVDAMEQLTKQLGRFDDNEGFLKLISGAKLA
ncbi:transcription termination factor Rho [Rhodopirellula sallentina]|uniref:Transcription termination factor Rho n=1 Tax=Rhodopirellula sallentina SM41 TaxID=1263870 RepID=M5UFL9_9BACT|nr:transcription termination factor Rho [Rhodopirellula sallentina]EMI56646.1 transcription termination factor Rho [Rhodopirellula sallentina SM41]